MRPEPEQQTGAKNENGDQDEPKRFPHRLASAAFFSFHRLQPKHDMLAWQCGPSWGPKYMGLRLRSRRGRLAVALWFVFSLFTFAFCSAGPASACASYGEQYSANHYLYDFFMHPATTCIQYFNPVARVVAAQNSVPACGTWMARTDAPGFQYTAGSVPCMDWFVVRIQMPDQGMWDYHYSIVVYPSDDPLPPP